MRNVLKKNRLMITALAIMIAVAGYLQFAESKLADEDYISASGDAQTNGEGALEEFTAGEVAEGYTIDELLEWSDDALEAAGFVEIESLDSDVEVITEDYLTSGMDPNISDPQASPESGEIPGEAVFTGTAGVAVLSEAKLLKEQVRAKNKETLMEIIETEGLSDEQKQVAVDAMVMMTTVAEKEMAAEILLEAKGFTDVVVSIAEDGVDVVINATVLSDAERAQIEDIVKRKTDTKAENIIISTVVQ